MTLSDLPPRERECALLLHAGRSAKDIARELHIGYGTARRYIRQLYQRVGVRERASLAVWVERQKNSAK